MRRWSRPRSAFASTFSCATIFREAMMYLGLDIGTSSVKGVLIDEKHKIVATATSPLKVSRPKPGWSEQNPEHWWKACNTVVKALGAAKPKAVAAVEGIGLSGQQHGATLIDKTDKVLRPAI